MKGSIIHNTGSAVTVRLPSGETVPAKSVIDALDIVEAHKSGCPLPAEVICGECFIEFGGIDCRCSGTDRSGQDSLPGQVEVQGPERCRAAADGIGPLAIAPCGATGHGSCGADGEGR
jgi:hypothetical protein